MEAYLKQVKNIASTFSTDTIFILGKGASVDRVNLDVLSNGLVIGINDAERIAPVDLTVFHDEWVKDAIADNGFRSSVYFSHLDFKPARGKFVRTPYAPMAADAPDLMMQRLLTDEFAIEEVLFLSALKLSRIIAKLRGRPQKVFMIGFDFSPGAGYAHALNRDYSASSIDEKTSRISPQEFYFVNTLYMLRQSEIDINHVGDRPFSTLSPEELNKMFLSARDASEGGEAGSGVLVIAELTTNHFGDRYRLERMIRAAKAAGADYVKLQKRDVESFYSKEKLNGPYVSPFGETFRDYRNALELDRDDFGFVEQLCRDVGIKWFASVLDEPSFRFMLEFQPDLVKLPSTISEHTDYLSYVARNYKGNIVLSTGMTDESYEKWVLETFTDCKNLYLLQCNSAYPTMPNDCSVGVIRHYRDLAKTYPHIIPGYSSHDFGWLASALAVAAGAQMLEKHVKLGNTEWAHFDAVAMDLTTADFKEYVKRIREAEVIVGSEQKKINGSEHHKYSLKAS